MAPEVAGEYNFAYALGNLGVYLLWHGDLDEAQEKLETALALAQRTYDRHCQLWCQSNLLLVGVRRHDVESVRALSQRTAAAVEGQFYPGTNFALHAAPAWVAWQEGRDEDAAFLARQVLQLWRESRFVYFYKGLCLWPLVSVSLASGDVGAALEASGEVLQPDQVRLPDELESLLHGARVAWDRADSAAAAVALNEALRLACELGYA
jgi:tetratricopeptide (TPR) repeat protein